MTALAANLESSGLYWLIVWSLAATAVWGAATAIVVCLRRNSAQARHRVWALSIIVVLLAPLLSPLLPVPRAWKWADAGEVEQNAFASRPTDRIKHNVDANTDRPVLGATARGRAATSARPVVEEMPAAIGSGSTAPTNVRRAAIEDSSRVAIAWPSVLVAIWLVGCTASLLLFAGGLWRVRRLRRRAVSVTGDTETELYRGICHQIGIRRDVKLLVTPQASVPLLAGTFDAAIILPPGFGRWSLDRLRVVLTHELIHLKRHDVLWEIVAQLAKIPTWFHPLAWFAAHRLRIERELACDDAVLLSGARPTDYAEQLVEVAREMIGAGPRLSPVVAMAGAGPIELRIRSILDPRTWRAPLGRWRTIALSSFMASLVLVVAALSPGIGDDRSTNQVAAASKQLVLRFPNDRTMGIVYWRKGPAKVSDRLWMYGEEWHKVAEARGEVRVPSEGEVRVEISKAASTDLTGLDQLRPDDIQGLNCRRTDVNNEGLRHIGRLTGLRMLNLDDTAITDAGSQAFAGLKSLKWVDLDKPFSEEFGVGDETLKVLSRLPDLEVIWLRGTKVTDAGMTELAHAKMLRDVEVPGTKISDEGMKYLKELPRLETLGLGVSYKVTNITDRGLMTIGEMTKLKNLDLSATKITDEGLTHLRNLSRLESLTLEGTKITEAGLAHLEPLQALQDLRLYLKSPVTDVGAAHLAKLKPLRRLTENLQITDQGVALLATLPNLEELELDGTGVTDKSAPLIGRMKSLKWLWFQDCPVTDAALASLSGLSNLELFRVLRTRVTGDGFRHLQKLPKLSLLGIDFGEAKGQPAGLHPNLREIGTLHQIERLELAGDGLTNDDLRDIASLSQLKDLELDFPVGDQGVEYLSGLRQLTGLRIKDGNVTDAGLKQISKFGKLNYLWIVGDFSDRGLEPLAELKSLWSLNLWSEQLTKDGVKAVQQRLPALQLVQTLSKPDHAPTFDEQVTQAFVRPTSAVQRNHDAKDFAQIADAGVLITFANPQAAVTKELYKLYFENDKVARAANDNYRTVAIPTAGAKRAEAVALAKELGVELPDPDQPLIVAEEADGKVLGVLKAAELVSKDRKISQDVLLAFIKRHAPPVVNARKLLDDVLAQAKRENKRVLIQETAVWCGPCHRLATFLDDNRRLWEKDYLWVRMDIRWTGEGEIVKSLRGEAQGGYPWLAIVDADGKVLATSNKPDDGSNIGFPTDPDSIEHFLHMLKATAQRMTADDLAKLKSVLEAANREK